MPRQLHIHVQPRRTAPVSQGGLRPGHIAEGLAHAVDEVVGGAAHFFVRQAAGPHDQLGNREVRLPAGISISVDKQRLITSAACCGANVDSVHQLQLRPCIACAHDHPVRVRADVVLDRRLPPSVVRHPCRIRPVAPPVYRVTEHTVNEL